MIELFGYIYNLSGDPVKGASITVLRLNTPDTNGMPWYPTYTVKTDISGYFVLNLLEGITVDIFIPSINFRRTLEVPSFNTNLFSIP